MHLQEIIVRPVYSSEEPVFQELMQAHHYLGALPKIGNTLWYVATYQNNWQALLVFSAAALKCGVRDHWLQIGGLQVTAKVINASAMDTATHVKSLKKFLSSLFNVILAHYYLVQ
jgi:hypothetical protein